MTFTTGSVASTGDVGVELFDRPSDAAQANLISSVTFSNVIADQTTPEPAALMLMGGGLVALDYFTGSRSVTLIFGASVEFVPTT